MLGINFIKFQPNIYVLKYQRGNIVSEGLGLSFFYYTLTTSLVAIPVSGMDASFMFEETTRDFQVITIQGQVNFRISDVKKLSTLLNYTLNPTGKGYMSDDPDKLPQRIIDLVRVLIKREIGSLSLKQALIAADTLTNNISEAIRTHREMVSLGVEILGLSILAILPTKETARALEAETREQILKEADDAIYARRNAAVEQERTIKENELNTEIAVERKKRQIRETQMEAKQAVQAKRHQLEENQMNFNIKLEEQKQTLTQLAVENAKIEADAKAYAAAKMMDVFNTVNPSTLQSLVSIGMAPETLIALAFQGLAEKADKIGELNISPDLLKSLIKHPISR
ncbi:SPFH domain / Band 7 family protein [Gammaproteobacteria bacterium]